MTKFLFKIIEHYSQVVSVEANTIKEAYEKVDSEWYIPGDFDSRDVIRLEDGKEYPGAYELK